MTVGVLAPAFLPLHLVTGFLGSGKTTLLNRVLRDVRFADSAVVVNEFGEVGLDQLVLTSSAKDNVVLLDSGCLCCAASGALGDTLVDLFSRRAAGTLPPFGRVIVETSGLANPGPIVAGLLGDSALRGRCELAQVLTLVDAVNGRDTLTRYAEARRQVAFADRIALSKTDVATPSQVQATTSAVRALNPHAEVTAVCEVGAPELFELAQRHHLPQAQHWLRGPLRPQYGAAAHDEDFARISTYTFEIAHAVDWAGYAAWCDRLRRHWGTRLLRCKGLLAMGQADPHGQARRFIVQGVQGYFAPPVPFEQTALAAGRNFIVCIGEGLDGEALARDFALLEPETTATGICS